MTDDAYYLATGQYPDGELPVLSDDEVLHFLAKHLSPAQVAGWSMRAEPADGVHPGPDWVSVEAAPLADGTGIAVAWSFGQPDEDEVLNWKKVWREVAGPMSVPEVVAYARDWADRTH